MEDRLLCGQVGWEEIGDSDVLGFLETMSLKDKRDGFWLPFLGIST